MVSVLLMEMPVPMVPMLLSIFQFLPLFHGQGHWRAVARVSVRLIMLALVTVMKPLEAGDGL